MQYGLIRISRPRCGVSASGGERHHNTWLASRRGEHYI
jgi:hypothetical protein